MLEKQLKKLFGELVEDWKQSYRWLSVQILALCTAFGTWAMAYPDQYQQVQAFIPEKYRPLVVMLLGFLIWYSRIKKQS